MVVVDNTFATPYLQQPLVARRRRRRPLRRRSTSAGTATWSAASSPSTTTSSPIVSLHAERGRRGAGTVRLLPRAARCEDTGRADGTPLRQRPVDRRPARRPPARRPRAVPAAARPPRPRRGGEADPRLRRHGQLHGARRAKRQRSRVAAATKVFTLGRIAGRGGEPDRAPARR